MGNRLFRDLRSCNTPTSTALPQTPIPERPAPVLSSACEWLPSESRSPLRGQTKRVHEFARQYEGGTQSPDLCRLTQRAIPWPLRESECPKKQLRRPRLKSDTAAARLPR